MLSEVEFDSFLSSKDSNRTQTFTYDALNRITGAAGYSYTYDDDGNRVRKSNGNLAGNGTLYWYRA